MIIKDVKRSILWAQIVLLVSVILFLQFLAIFIWIVVGLTLSPILVPYFIIKNARKTKNDQ